MKEPHIDNGVLFGVNECAKLCKITKQGIRKAIKEKRLNAVKVGNSWVIHPYDLNYFNITRSQND